MGFALKTKPLHKTPTLSKKLILKLEKNFLFLGCFFFYPPTDTKIKRRALPLYRFSFFPHFFFFFALVFTLGGPNSPGLRALKRFTSPGIKRGATKAATTHKITKSRTWQPQICLQHEGSTLLSLCQVYAKGCGSFIFFLWINNLEGALLRTPHQKKEQKKKGFL